MQDLFRWRLASVRKQLGHNSQASLAKRLRELGYDLGETAIARIESGKRNVSLEDALAIAAALDISPLSLFLPPDDDEQPVQLTPDLVVPARTALRWMAGRWPLDSANIRGFLSQLPEIPRAITEQAMPITPVHGTARVEESESDAS